MARKKWIQRVVSLVSALLFLLFGANLGTDQFCLGDWILTDLGLPAWSKGTQGLHYPGIIALIGLVLSFYFFSATTNEPKKTTAWLIVGSIALLYTVQFLLNLL